jgi:hypothetical protein
MYFIIADVYFLLKYLSENWPISTTGILRKIISKKEKILEIQFLFEPAFEIKGNDFIRISQVDRLIGYCRNMILP